MAGRRRPRVPRVPRGPVTTPIATDIFIPNHSGDNQAGRMLRTPENDYDLVNKKYVDDNTSKWVKEFTIINPNEAQDITNEIFIGWADEDLTIEKIQIELDISTQQVTGDLKYANEFLSLASPIVINDFDTTSGKRTDTTITSGSVASGKAIYLSFDAQPHADIKQMHVRIDGTYQ